MRTFNPLPTARRAVPMAAVVLPLPGPLFTMISPLRTSAIVRRPECGEPLIVNGVAVACTSKRCYHAGHGTPVFDVLCRRFDRAVSLLQKAGRRGDGAVERRSIRHGAGSRDELGCADRETHDGQHAFALDKLPYHRRGKGGPQPRL